LALDFAPDSGGRKKVQHHSTFEKKVIINTIWLRLSVSDWLFIMVAPGGLLD
jgi:hypothetical protein